MTERTGATAADPIVRELLAGLRSSVERDRLDAVSSFAESYVRRMAPETLRTTSPEELSAEVIGAFRLADARAPGDAAVVRVFTPSTAADGYETQGSAVETNTLDMPFLVDSVTNVIEASGRAIRHVEHPVVGIDRDASGRIVRVVSARDVPPEQRESVMHFDLEGRIDREGRASLETAVRTSLDDVRLAVRDFAAMKRRTGELADEVASRASSGDADEVVEAAAFLRWLIDANFVLLGMRSYDLLDGTLAVTPGSGLGILADEAASTFHHPQPLDELGAAVRQRLAGGPLLVIGKTSELSRVHRSALMDDVAVRRTSGDGTVLGEVRLVGLLTSKAYLEPANRMPLLRRKLDGILRTEDYFEGSHDFKSAVEIFDSFPKDELFAAGVEELRRAIVSLLQIQERDRVRLYMRRDPFGRSVSLIVALPDERFDPALRRRLEELFLERFGGDGVESSVALPVTTAVARIHVTVHAEGGVAEDVDLGALEAEVASLARTWDDKLADRLVRRLGRPEGERLAARWSPLLPDYYKSSVDPRMAVLDIQQLERVGVGEPFAVALQNERSANRSLTRIELYKAGEKVPLTDFLPILEDLGLQVIEEVPTRIPTGEGTDIFIHDFGVLDAAGRLLDLEAVGERIVELVTAVRSGSVESDSLNRLVVGAGLDWRQVEIVRAYWRYRQRVGTQFTPELAFNAFVAHPELTSMLVRYFELRFAPELAGDTGAPALRDEIIAALDDVASLDEDRVLRSLLASIEATQRTNAYRPDRTHLSFKIRSGDVPEMPKPTPFMEIYVYSPEMEGIHLRGGPVARGGLRWSDRQEDYRTEVLGLMKAQMVKNAVIVPVGSKGGFVLKRATRTREELGAEVVRQYRTFIRGLLDVTDNRAADGTISHPDHVRVHDGDDPYLVVAADKGTATFSDTANGIAHEYGFWLDDAFASGGSAGYDHKALGITARGAWESVRRHFRELGIDVDSDPFTVVGVGDMSGDVFGNGMLLSRAIRLVAAFDHRHVFVDPDPDLEASFAERKRLFELPGSSWDDYDRTLISKGGGVFARSEKSIALTDEMRAVLGTDARTATPADLLSAILRAPVDLFWNGGIGTFVRASEETQAEVGDRTNDAIRVTAPELRVRVVAEGGNLGLTQRARIEYAAAGGRINNDAIDNSAGVDTSDHEVNLKILVGIAEQRGDLTRKQRDVLLASVADDVCRHVLYTNYQQNQILSQELALSTERSDSAEDLMAALSLRGLLDREVEFLPSTEELEERRRLGRGLTRPELAVLLAYAKRSLDEDVVSSGLPDDPYLDSELEHYFPAPIVERFRELLPEHPLRRELISTIVANDVVNSQGITFVSRMASETGAEPAEVARAFWIARAVSGATSKWEHLEALDGQLDPELQRRLMSQVDDLVEANARWYLQRLPNAPLGETIAEHAARFVDFEAAVPEAGSAGWREHRDAAAERLVASGVPEGIARRHAYLAELEHGPDAIQVAAATGRPITDVAQAFFLVGDRLHLETLESRLERLPVTTRWQGWAAQAASDDLLRVRRLGAERVLAGDGGGTVPEAVEAFVSRHREASERLRRLVALADGDASDDLSVLAVAIRGVRNVVA